jgi:hypothetical protein
MVSDVYAQRKKISPLRSAERAKIAISPMPGWKDCTLIPLCEPLLNIVSILRLLIGQPSTCLVVQLLQGSQDLLRKNVALLVEEDEQALLSLHQLGQEEVVDLLDLVRNKELGVDVIKLFSSSLMLQMALQLLV